METAEHSTRPSVLPAKLRWRPYANGNTFKANGRRKQATEIQQQKQQQQPELQHQQELDVKMFAKKVRAKSHRPGKSHTLPVELELHWEQGETLESMSHGGYHGTHHDHLGHGHIVHHKHDSQSDDSGSEGSAARSRPHYRSTKSSASASLPSPPTSSTSPSSLGLDFSGEEPDFTRFKASVPSLTGSDFLRQGLPVPGIEGNSSFHVALNSLLENHRNQQQRELQQKQAQQQKTPDQSSVTLALSDIPSPTSVVGPPATLSTWGGSTNSTFPTCYPTKSVSATELLGMSNIEELLASCGYGVSLGDPNSLSMGNGPNILASPISSTQSVHSSPVHGASDFFDPSVPTMAQLEALIAQVPLIQGDVPQPSAPHQSQQPTLSATATTTTTTSFTDLFQGFTSPFTFLSGGDPLISGNSTSSSSMWPSLFPKATEEVVTVGHLVSPKLVEAAVQTDGWSSNKSSPQVAKAMSPPSASVSSQGSPLEISEQVATEPEWLAFLDEAVSSSNMESVTSPSSGADINVIESAPLTSSPGHSRGSSKGLLDFAGDMLSVHAMTPTGYRNGFSTSSGSYGRTDGAGAGSLVRMLKKGGSQRTSNSDRTKTGSFGARPNIPSLPRPSTSQKPVVKRERTKVEEEKTSESVARKAHPTRVGVDSMGKMSPDRVPTAGAATSKAVASGDKDGMGGLMAMFRGLWRGNGDT